MIEDELRALLGDRAGGLPDNPARVADVRSRIGGMRRRRAAGTALALVLLAIAGLVLTRLPGRPDALPTGVPPGPWFQESGFPDVPGYAIADTGLRGLGGPTERLLLTTGVPLRYLVAVRCAEPGTLVVRNVGPGGDRLPVDCDRRARDRYEGIAVVEPDRAERLFAPVSADRCCNVEFVPGSAGRWDVGLLVALAPDRLGPSRSTDPPLRDGAAGDGTVQVTVPRRQSGVPADLGFSVAADCVAGVRLELTAAGTPLAVLSCDEAHGLSGGQVQATVPQAALDRLGLRPGDRFAITVRSTGRQTDQWRLYPVG